VPWLSILTLALFGGYMDRILRLLKPENIRVLLFLLGIVLLGRSLATTRPEYGVTILTAQEQPQDILMYFHVEVQRYIMTMLWPVVFALLNSLYPKIKVSKPFFYTIIGLHIISLFISLIWYFNYIPNNQEGASHLEQGLAHMQFSATIVFIVSLISAVFSLIWFSKGWVIFKSDESP
jgi:hypothetical protein